MKKIILLTIISIFLSLTACVYDSMFCVPITNRTNDTVLIYTSQYNNIDSIKAGISADWFFELNDPALKVQGL